MKERKETGKFKSKRKRPVKGKVATKKKKAAKATKKKKFNPPKIKQKVKKNNMFGVKRK